MALRWKKTLFVSHLVALGWILSWPAGALAQPPQDPKPATPPPHIQAPPLGRSPGRGGFIERLDRNGDGGVSKDEFDGPKDRFQNLDKNGDGLITADEAPSGPPPNRPLRP